MTTATMTTSMTAPAGLFDLPQHNDTTPSLELLHAQQQYDKGEAFLAWSRYIGAERIFNAISADDPELDRRFLDDTALTTARLAATRRITKWASNTMLTEAFALTYRIPLVGQCLREGTINHPQFQQLVSHTDLIDGMPYSPDVDADLAYELRLKQTWTRASLKNTADRIIGRYDLDAVRRRRAAAKDHRDCWTKNLDDGMGMLTATASADDIALAMAAITMLADSVCADDPRTAKQRRSDALICRAQGTAFECHCGNTDCDAAPDTTRANATPMKTVLYLIAQDATLTPPTDFGPPTEPHDRWDTPDEEWTEDDWADQHTWTEVTAEHADSGANAIEAKNENAPDEPAEDNDEGDEGEEGDDGLWANNPRPAPDDDPPPPAATTPHNQAADTPETNTDTATKTAPRPDTDANQPREADQARYARARADGHLAGPVPQHLLKRILNQNDPAPYRPEDAPITTDPRADGTQRPGFLNGYGLITADQVREIAAKPHTIIRQLNPHPGEPLPSCLPSDPYRFSAALDTYIRARHGYCAAPGCTAPAWSCDIDHTTEYDHAHPESGGRTTPGNGKPYCRFHHLVKTFGNWLDEQYTDKNGYTHTVLTTPEGLSVHSHAQTNEDLFPALRSIRFTDPPTQTATPRRSDPPPGEPQRRRTRLADKLSRRRAERKHNHDIRIADPYPIKDQPDF